MPAHRSSPKSAACLGGRPPLLSSGTCSDPKANSKDSASPPHVEESPQDKEIRRPSVCHSWPVSSPLPTSQSPCSLLPPLALVLRSANDFSRDVCSSAR